MRKDLLLAAFQSNDPNGPAVPMPQPEPASPHDRDWDGDYGQEGFRKPARPKALTF